jgi:hypothetical protein
MDIVAALRSEERKLEARLGGIKQAILALNGHTSGRVLSSSNRGSKLRGRKLSKEHVLAIKRGIARKKAFARKAGKQTGL